MAQIKTEFTRASARAKIATTTDAVIALIDAGDYENADREILHCVHDGMRAVDLFVEIVKRNPSDLPQQVRELDDIVLTRVGD